MLVLDNRQGMIRPNIELFTYFAYLLFTIYYLLFTEFLEFTLSLAFFIKYSNIQLLFQRYFIFIGSQLHTRPYSKS